MQVPSSLHVKVRPNAREDRFTPGADGVWLACIKAPPVDGKANAALIALVADHFNLRKQQIRIKSGGSSRSKRLLIDP